MTLGLLGAQGRIRITGPGIIRDREIFFGLLDQLRPARFIDFSILIAGVCIGLYLFFFSYYLKRLLQLNIRYRWLQLHIVLVFLLVAFPLFFYQDLEFTTPDRPTYSERFLPLFDDLTGHTYSVLLRVEFVQAASYIYALVANLLLIAWCMFKLIFAKGQDTTDKDIAIEDHLLG